MQWPSNSLRQSPRRGSKSHRKSELEGKGRDVARLSHDNKSMCKVGVLYVSYCLADRQREPPNNDRDWNYTMVPDGTFPLLFSAKNPNSRFGSQLDMAGKYGSIRFS